MSEVFPPTNGRGPGKTAPLFGGPETRGALPATGTAPGGAKGLDRPEAAA
ncbi:hypothetical protein GCM10017673_32220 [Streptosporangium violaceochromogenes]|nr:hypothetical protein GCM10017673_32220 [Streptosporangium violaceochromogenes]